jgi:MFS family permease
MTTPDPAAPAARLADPASAWAPLAIPTFRTLWIVWLTANICMGMNDVAAAWLMTSLTHSPVMVALVQSAAAAPVFLLGIPSGALADILDRRRYFMATQFWVAIVAVLLFVASVTDALSPHLLLVLTFANGVGFAMRWPVFAAIMPELVPRAQMPAAQGLNGVAMNVSRIIGPMLAGAMLAAANGTFVYAVNAVASMAAGFAIMRWRRTPTVSKLPAERFLGAIRVGVQYIAQSPPLRVVMLRIFVFFTQSTALLALLPVVAKSYPGAGAGTYTVLLAGMGAGAIVAALAMTRLRRHMGSNAMVRYGTLLHAAMTVAVALAPNVWVALPAMFVAGMAWIVVANAMLIVAQFGLPDWVRARGMAIMQTALMGGNAIGAAIWGQAASMFGLRAGLIAAATAAVVSLLLVQRFKLQTAETEDLRPARVWKDPETAFPVDPHDGPVMVTIRYCIDPARAAEFAQVMQESRRFRLQHGALAWELLRDTAVPDTWIEYYVDESWAQHLRRFDRATAADVALTERKYAFHLGPDKPAVARYIAQSAGDVGARAPTPPGALV